MSYRTKGLIDKSRLVLPGEGRNRLVGLDCIVDLQQQALGYRCNTEEMDLWSSLRWQQLDDPHSTPVFEDVEGDIMAKLWDSGVDLEFMSDEGGRVGDWTERPLEESEQESRQEKERIRGLPGLELEVLDQSLDSYPTITPSSSPITSSFSDPGPSTITPSEPIASESYPYRTHKRPAARALKPSNPIKSSSDPSRFPDSNPNTSTPLSAEEDKRRRNTAASARFRAKKKQRENWLEQRSTELEQLIAELRKECSVLRKENAWLKSLVKGDVMDQGALDGALDRGLGL